MDGHYWQNSKLRHVTLSPYFSCFLIMLSALCAYSTSFHVPFYLDDLGSITNNQNFDDASYTSLFEVYGLRVLGYVGLWLNFEYAQLDVVPYHIVNLVIHSLCGITVYFLVLKLSQILNLFDQREYRTLLACFVGLLFVLHPLQTQAVTYIVQRLASQVALFYLAALVFYLFARTSTSVKAVFGYSSAALIFAIAAIFTKQNAFTLPLVILLCEWLLFHSVNKKHVIAAGVMTGIGVFIVLFSEALPEVLYKIDMLSRESTKISRFEYFKAQLPILWGYIGKVFWPWPLQLEFDYTVNGFTRTQIVLSGLGHISVIIGALLLRKNYALVTWGVLFYYTAHIVESGFIPITDIAFEHRNYLPNLGLFTVVGYLIVLTAVRLSSELPKFKTAGLVTPVAIVIACAVITYHRNNQWLDPEVFLTHDLEQAPNSPRAIHNYAEFKLRKGETQTAIKYLDRLYSLEYDQIDAVMLNTYLAALIDSGKNDEAIEKGRKMLEHSLTNIARSIINSNIGIAYTNKQQYKLANRFFEKAYKLHKTPVNSLIAWAYTKFVLRDFNWATKLCNEILLLEPQHAKAKLLLSMIEKELNS